MKLDDLRNEYTRSGLCESEVDDDPVRQFERWLGEAVEAGLPEPTAMTLATANAAGEPSARIVLLKGYDSGGFVFYTNYESRKGRELAVNPHAALLFFWPQLERQIRIEGSVDKASRELTERYFSSRPRGSRLGAWASPQSKPLSGREELEARFAEAERRFPEDEIPPPPHWGGFLLRPSAFEFWQGRASRLHDRLRYRRSAKGWTIERLAP